MPTYSFKCSDCNLKFDRFMKMSEDIKHKCPKCKSMAQKLPAQGVGVTKAEPTSIPKEIDLKVGRDADKKREEYEKRKKLKNQIRKQSGSMRLARDMDGKYVPLSESLKDQNLSEDQVVNIRKNVYEAWDEIKNDPESTKIKYSDEASDE